MADETNPKGCGSDRDYGYPEGGTDREANAAQISLEIYKALGSLLAEVIAARIAVSKVRGESL